MDRTRVRQQPISRVSHFASEAFDFMSQDYNNSQQQGSAGNLIKTLNTNFIGYLICLTVAMSLMLLGIGLLTPYIGITNSAGNADADTLCGMASLIFSIVGVASMVLAMIAFVASIIFWCILHYHLWNVIPKGIARTTPGKAVGLMFIPLFNLYWMFVSCLGLSKDLNKTLQQSGIRYQASEELGLTFCILTILSLFCINPYPGLSFIDLLGVAVSVAACVVSIIFYKSVKDGAITLLEQNGN